VGRSDVLRTHRILEENFANSYKPPQRLDFKTSQAHIQKFSSFMDLTTDHFQNLGATLSRQVTIHVHKNQRQTNAAITFLLNLILSYSEYVDASSLILQFQTQLQQSIAGQLPRDLITPGMLEDET
jgi:lipase chaperone LimK